MTVSKTASLAWVKKRPAPEWSDQIKSGAGEKQRARKTKRGSITSTSTADTFTTNPANGRRKFTSPGYQLFDLSQSWRNLLFAERSVHYP
jgi:hypothetical protein